MAESPADADTPEGPPARQPHAVMDVESRQWKAIKIERLLGLDAGSGPVRLLEVGTGSGGIAHYFGTHGSNRFDVDAVDVIDNRLVKDGYRYTQVMDTVLPFAAGSFDVVLSNHVIEHVGDAAQQLLHLAELFRVMKPDAIGYLAVPNRWMLTEPHYQLRFLSWLPRAMRSPYLRWSGKGSHYDCEPLQAGELEAMFSTSGFEAENVCVRAMRETFAIERPGSRAHRVLQRIPEGLLQPLRTVIPTLIYRFRRSDRDRDAA